MAREQQKFVHLIHFLNMDFIAFNFTFCTFTLRQSHHVDFMLHLNTAASRIANPKKASRVKQILAKRLQLLCANRFFCILFRPSVHLIFVVRLCAKKFSLFHSIWQHAVGMWEVKKAHIIETCCSFFNHALQFARFTWEQRSGKAC